PGQSQFMTENHVRLPICFINAQTNEWVRPGSQTIVERLKTHFCGFSGNAVAGLGSTPLRASSLGPRASVARIWNSIPKTRNFRSRNPRRPSFREEVMLSDLQLGKSNIDLSIRWARCRTMPVDLLFPVWFWSPLKLIAQKS